MRREKKVVINVDVVASKSVPQLFVKIFGTTSIGRRRRPFPDKLPSVATTTTATTTTKATTATTATTTTSKATTTTATTGFCAAMIVVEKKPALMERSVATLQSQSNRTPPSITQKWERPMHKHNLTEMPQGDRKRIQRERVRVCVRPCVYVCVCVCNRESQR